MKNFNLFDSIELKKELKTQFGINLHYHDTCSGQYFELEESNELVTDYITNYFFDKNYAVIFNDKRNMFTIKESKPC